MSVIAIDPGNVQSAYVRIDDDCRPLTFGKLPNADVREWLKHQAITIPASCATFAVEMVASYGMSVGADVFETCVWIGRFAETIECRRGTAEFVYRRDIKLHHCGSSRAKDANITQALIDRFAPGQPNRGKGTKNAPGWFYGFVADVWQAYALAVYVADTDIRIAS